MWLHLLSLGLIDGASDTGVEPVTETPRRTGRVLHRRYAMQLDGRWIFFDDPKEIADLLKEEAQEEASEVRSQKPRAKIVVKAGRDQAAQVQTAKAPTQAQIAQAQHAVRQMYRFAYAQAMKAIEEDEEDAILAMLS